MSNPPSPQRPFHEESSVTTTTNTAAQQPSTTTLSSTLMPGVVAPAPALSTFFGPASVATTGPSTRLPVSVSASSSAPVELEPPEGPTITTHAPQPTQPVPSTVLSSGSRGGRKSKAHVASACVNCKRAHLSCDVNRPCARCVASGKQDTCFDVQHKKRGRPRLREEGELRIEQMIPEPGPSTGPSTVLSTGSGSSARPLVATRHRRQESFRSLRSQGSDGSGIASSPSYPYPPPPSAAQATFRSQFPPTFPSAMPTYEVATAYLDLDLTLIKSNTPFRQIMLAGQEVAGRQLHEIAAPMDSESFNTIRMRLRAERDAHEPAYMPPINQPGQDPLQGASVVDVERYTQGFEDRMHTWTQTQLGVAAQTFPVRVRLAKANVYWVAITLPSFHPMESTPTPVVPSFFSHMQPLAPGSQTQTLERYAQGRQGAMHAAPSIGHMSFPGSAVALQRPRPGTAQAASAQTFPGPQSLTPYQQQQTVQSYQTAPPTTYRLPIAEPPTETTAFTPRSTARELPNPHTIRGRAAIQLPPIAGSPAPGPGMSSAGRAELRSTDIKSPRSEADEGEDAEGRSRSTKRRRMDIDDVLHR